MDSFLFYIPFKGKERPAKTKFIPAKLLRRLTLREVRLRTVYATFGFSENLVVDSQYHHMDPKLPGNGDFGKSKKFV